MANQGGAAVGSGQGGTGAHGTEAFPRRARAALEASGNSTLSDDAWQPWLASEMASLGIRSQVMSHHQRQPRMSLFWSRP